MAVRDYSKYGVVTSNTTIPTTNNKPSDNYRTKKATTPKTTTTPKNPFTPSYFPTFPETKPLAPDLTGRVTTTKPTTQTKPTTYTQAPKTTTTPKNPFLPSYYPTFPETKPLAPDLTGRVTTTNKPKQTVSPTFVPTTYNSSKPTTNAKPSTQGGTGIPAQSPAPSTPSVSSTPPVISQGSTTPNQSNQQNNQGTGTLNTSTTENPPASAEGNTSNGSNYAADSYIRDYINELLEAQRARELAALEAAKIRALTGLDAALGNRKTALEKAKSGYLTNLDTALQSAMENIANEQAKIDPYYYDLRNQAQAGSDVQAMNFAQYMASRGIKGSAAGMPEIYRNAALQGQIGGLNRQQAANQAEIERMRTTTQNQYNTNRANVLSNYEADLLGLTNEYETNKQGMLNAYDQDLLAAQSGIDARGLQAYIDQMNADRLFSLNEAGITGKYKGDLTLAGQEFQQKLDDRAKASWLDTINRFSGDYDAEINRVMNDNDTTNDWQIPYLQAAKQKESQAKAEQRAAQAAAASAAEQQRYKQALDLWKTYGEATADIAAILGVPVGARTADYNIDSINAANNADSQKISTDEKISAITREFSNGTPEAAYEELINYASDYIADLGMSSYNQLLNYYKNLAGL